ncbi:L-idonate 5-dehydrogenase [Bosea sp. Leaf344]|uniref:L-idonate 5-dehydrogenase n=1 Tax=Bosea sp. Leaf344 TaxID=1736346 RepID=UPI0006FAE116|nr:L-idonate 5-dehydrogenase [Bosea sp. Leaf344]KQU50136.1 L-idonate 5-dehydrogenase [Bosea sp. Leaf344]
MRAVVIHAEKDLRVEPTTAPELGPLDVRVRIEAGGICGSDLHYYLHGGFGTIRVREPMILGHEIAGTVEAVGGEVGRVRPGDRVAVNPSRSCGRCRYCQMGQQQHCTDMLFYGSAMRFPHVQGGFRDVLVVEERQAVKVAAGVSAAMAAFAEPLSVCLHAVKRAGPLLGKRVLVTGSGPIGILTVIAARVAGAAEIVATDVVGGPLATARKMGAAAAIDVMAEPERLKAEFGAEKGAFDVMFEASGNQHALAGAFEVVRPGGVIVQIGVGGAFTLPMNVLVAKEFDLRGSFRFHEEFDWAVQMIGSGAVDLSPLLTASIPVERAVEAFELAADKSKAMKVQLAFA